MLTASLPTFMAGMVLAWPSPVIEYMSTGRVPVLLTPKQMSWMVACIDLGDFVMAVPAGLLMDRMGRKFIVNMSPPLMFTGWMFLLYGRQVRIAFCFFFPNRYILFVTVNGMRYKRNSE
jgi:SP family facilitated glucose transporter-like MFS transporter 8